MAKRITEVGEHHVCTSIIVGCELRYCAAKRALVKLARQLEAVLDAMEILPFESGADRHCAAIRGALERKGTPIGANGMLIAARACAVGAVCVTASLAEFRRVPGLKVENWLARS